MKFLRFGSGFVMTIDAVIKGYTINQFRESLKAEKILDEKGDLIENLYKQVNEKSWNYCKGWKTWFTRFSKKKWHLLYFLKMEIKLINLKSRFENHKWWTFFIFIKHQKLVASTFYSFISRLLCIQYALNDMFFQSILHHHRPLYGLRFSVLHSQKFL